MQCERALAAWDAWLTKQKNLCGQQIPVLLSSHQL